MALIAILALVVFLLLGNKPKKSTAAQVLYDAQHNLDPSTGTPIVIDTSAGYDSTALLDVTNGAGDFGDTAMQLLNLSTDAQPIDPWAGFPPVQLPRVGS